MHTRLPVLLTLALIAVVSSGCFTSQFTVPSEQRRSSYDVVGSFESKHRTSWLLFGLVSVREAEVEEIVAREVNRYDGDAATNVRVTTQYDATDVLLSILVGGLYNTRSYRVTGDIVKLNEGIVDRVDASSEKEEAIPILGAIRYEEEML